MRKIHNNIYNLLSVNSTVIALSGSFLNAMEMGENKHTAVIFSTYKLKVILISYSYFIIIYASFKKM